MDCRQFLQMSDPPKAKHGTLSSSEWLVSVLGAVVQPSADFGVADGAKGFECCTVGVKPIGDETLGLNVLPQ